MKTASPALVSLLASRQFLMADLYTLTLKSGTVLRYTSADVGLSYGGHWFEAMTIKRGRTRLVMGIEVDQLDVTVWATPDDLLEGQPFMAAVRIGALDGADLLLERAFMATWGDTSPGTLYQFGGRVAEATPGRHECKITVKSYTELLNVQLPRNLYIPQCLLTLYSSECGVIDTDFRVSGSLGPGSGYTTLASGLVGFPTGWFDLGKITFLTGPNAGVSRAIREFDSGGTLVVVPPLKALPSSGDTFYAWPGCDKRPTTCGTLVYKAFTAASTTDLLTCAKHGLGDGDRVRFSNTGGALPAPLSSANIYYVISALENTFQVSATYGGLAIDLTTNGTGTNKVRNIGKYDNLIHFRGTPYVPKPETAM